MSFLGHYKEGMQDFLAGAKDWRIAHLLGYSLLRQRYSRSRLGQLWLSLSTAITVIAFGLVWSILWNQPIKVFLPYIAITHIVWGLITASLQDATSVLSVNGALFSNQETSFATAIYALVYRQLIVLAHNFLVIFAVWVVFRPPLNWGLVYFLPGLFLTVLTCVLMAYLIALIATRFRDVVQIITNLIQIAYLLTPVMWMPEFMPKSYSWLLVFNPFAVFLSLTRDPLLGRPVPEIHWLIAGGITLFLVIITPYLVGRFSKRVVFWI